MKRSMPSCRMSCRIITGGKGRGKTTRILELADECPVPQGFVSLHVGDEYYLQNLKDGTKRLLMTTSPLFPDRFGKWYYDRKVFEYANERLVSIGNGVVFLDEAGRLELSGDGFAPSIHSLLENEGISLFLTVRDEFLDAMIKHFSIKNPEIEDV